MINDNAPLKVFGLKMMPPTVNLDLKSHTLPNSNPKVDQKNLINNWATAADKSMTLVGD